MRCHSSTVVSKSIILVNNNFKKISPDCNSKPEGKLWDLRGLGWVFFVWLGLVSY